MLTTLLYYITTCVNAIAFCGKGNRRTHAHARTYKRKSIAFTILTYFNNVAYWSALFYLTAVINLMRNTLYFITTTAMCYCTLTQLDHCTLIQHIG